MSSDEKSTIELLAWCQAEVAQGKRIDVAALRKILEGFRKKRMLADGIRRALELCVFDSSIPKSKTKFKALVKELPRIGSACKLVTTDDDEPLLIKLVRSDNWFGVDFHYRDETKPYKMMLEFLELGAAKYIDMNEQRAPVECVEVPFTLEVSNKRRNRTALHWAALMGNPDTVKVLLDQKGVDVNLQTSDGNTALHFAMGNAERIGADDAGEKIEWSRNDISNLVKTLLAHPDLDVNIKNNQGKTALQVGDWKRSINEENFATLMQLPSFDESTIDVCTLTGIGTQACILNHHALKTLVLEKLLNRPGFDVNSSDADGNTTLMMVAAQCTMNNYMQKLVTNYADIDVNMQNKSGRTALHFACEGGEMSACNVATLCALGDKLKACEPDKDLATPLGVAIWNGNIDCVEVLLKERPVDNGANSFVYGYEDNAPTFNTIVGKFADARPHTIPHAFENIAKCIRLALDASC